MVIIYILLLVIAVFSVMSFFSLQKIKRQNRNETDFSDDRYYELKYKLQFISSVGVIIIGVCGFLGYDKYDKFVDQFDKKTDSLNLKLNKYDERIGIIDSAMMKYGGKIVAYNKFLKAIEANKNKLNKSFGKTNEQLGALIDTIDNIKKRNILDKSFYVIDELKYQNHLEQTQRYYFKDMTTIIGDKLPIFGKKPVLFLIPQPGVDLIIKTFTNEYIEIGVGGFSSFEDDPKYFTFGLLISRIQ